MKAKTCSLCSQDARAVVKLRKFGTRKPWRVLVCPDHAKNLSTFILANSRKSLGTRQQRRSTARNIAKGLT